jgi:nitrogen regulatory protein PII
VQECGNEEGELEVIKIEAIVRPDPINIVIEALNEVGCRGFNVQNINGRGQQKGVEVFTGRGTTTATRTSLPKALITTVEGKNHRSHSEFSQKL